MAGAPGALAGSMLGGVVFGALAVWLAYRWIDELQSRSIRVAATREAEVPLPVPASGEASGQATGQATGL
jgi:hypothetical protein